MGFRFRKSVKAGPFRMTFSKSGVGYSVGGKGFRVTKKARGGIRTTANLPGTGISYTSDIGGGRKKSSRKSSNTTRVYYQSPTSSQRAASTVHNFCSECGTAITVGAHFCANCGTKISAPAAIKKTFNLLHSVRKCLHYAIRIILSFIVWFISFVALVQIPPFVDRDGSDVTITSPIPLLLPIAIAAVVFFLLKKLLNKNKYLQHPDFQRSEVHSSELV